VSEIKGIRKSQNLLFLKKKKQKNFVNMGFVCAGLPVVSSKLFEEKFFASFFQKRCFAFSCIRTS